MDQFLSLVTAALADPFRIVLLVGLVLTQRRTKAQTGVLIPLALGVLFVAALLPMTMGFGAEAGQVMAIGAGVVANVILLVPMLLVAHLWDRRAG